MFDFFKGWRRKAGVVTLGLACVLLGGWIWSCFESGYITVSVENINFVLNSAGGNIRATTYDGMKSTLSIGPGRIWMEKQWGRTFLLIGTGSTVIVKDAESDGKPLWVPGSEVIDEWLSVPYWSLVWPLTLLSAYLLLWTPRPKREAKPDA
jgi:hypothetical protein